MGLYLQVSGHISKQGLHLALLEQRCRVLLHLLNLEDADVSVVLMDDARMAEYNQQYRRKEGPTNVLSFPADGPEGEGALLTADLGDVLISVDTARHEALTQGVDLHRRLLELIIHGILHLIGYDHERSEEEALRMWDEEQRLFQQIQKTRRTVMPNLAVNIDHVATLRQARGGKEPDPVTAAGLCELAGADGIVIHLREDRRHIQDRDLLVLRQMVKTKLNLEMATEPEIVDIALKILPDMVTLVPEKRKELTTEGGLDVLASAKRVGKVIGKMSKAGIPVSLFIDPEEKQIRAAMDLGATFVELHTGRYCEARSAKEQGIQFRLIEQAAEQAHEMGLLVNAGHGLDYRNVQPIAALPTIEELSIGHAIISRAVLVGLDHAVREMIGLVKSVEYYAG